MTPAPFDIALNHAALQSFGLPDDRLARVAARRAFVEMKQAFMRASADIAGPTGEMLQRKVRAATEAMELWRLRSAVMDSLAEAHERTPSHRLELRRQLDSLFPEGGSDTSFAPL
ncbi:MAG TPA: hypothetical protein VJ608_03255 [Albitalea sp.]|nr:hypothetical protein [Albitalea sp.]